MKQSPSTIEEHINQLEKSLITGRGRWIADFTESKRNYRIDDVEFDAFIEGNTRMKGFLLSRLFSFLLNPNYAVNCFVLSTKSGRNLDEHLFRKALAAIRSYMKNNEIKWSWLFIYSTEKMPHLRSVIEKMDDQTIGVVFVDIRFKEVSHSNSYLGKQAKGFVKV